jgi:hypothetical protein
MCRIAKTMKFKLGLRGLLEKQKKLFGLSLLLGQQMSCTCENVDD